MPPTQLSTAQGSTPRPRVDSGETKGTQMKMRAAIRAIGENLTMRVIETRVSLPIPVRRGNDVIVHRLVSTGRVTPQGTYLTAPEYIATADYDSGRFLAVERASPAALSVALSGNADPYTPPSFGSPQDIIDTYNRFYDLHDVVLPAFRSQGGGVSPAVAAAAREILTLFSRLAEPPNEPYYQALGGEFYAWLRQIAGRH